jgi:hypothetical protein
MLTRRTPLRPKGKYKSAALERHHDRVAQQGCCVCGREATVHHVTGYADRMGRFSRDHWLVAPLCPQHHQAVYDDASMPVSVERLGHRGFFREHGIDLLALAERLREESLREESRRAA